MLSREKLRSKANKGSGPPTKSAVSPQRVLSFCCWLLMLHRLNLTVCDYILKCEGVLSSQEVVFFCFIFFLIYMWCTILGGVPRGLVTFWRSQSPAQLFLMSENKRGQNSKSGDRHVTETDAAPVWDCCPSPLSSRPRPAPISSHYSVTWNQEGKGSEKRTPTISSIFLMNPIFCLRAQGALVRPW